MISSLPDCSLHVFMLLFFHAEVLGTCVQYSASGQSVQLPCCILCQQAAYTCFWAVQAAC